MPSTQPQSFVYCWLQEVVTLDIHATTDHCVLLITGSCHAWYPRYHRSLCIGDCRKWSRFPRYYNPLCTGDCRKWSRFPRYYNPLCIGDCRKWSRFPLYYSPLCIGDCRKWSRFPRYYNPLCTGDCRKWSRFPRYHSPVCNADCWKYNYVMVTLSTLPQSFVYWWLQEVLGQAVRVTTVQCVTLFACRRYRSLVCNAVCM